MTTKYYLCVNFAGEDEWLRGPGKPNDNRAEVAAQVEMMNRNYGGKRKRYAVCTREGRKYTPVTEAQ